MIDVRALLVRAKIDLAEQMKYELEPHRLHLLRLKLLRIQYTMVKVEAGMYPSYVEFEPCPKSALLEN